jgi:hypothetical protein
MTDYVIQAPDAATLQTLAQSLGFWDAAASTFVAQGPIPGDPNPQASYFLNVVGSIAGQAGYWARLRLNGLNPFASGLLTIPAGITIYPPTGDPSEPTTYVQPEIGAIA